MLWENFKAFMAQPFNSDNMSAVDWFLFMGLIIVILVIWNMIFAHIKESV